MRSSATNKVIGAKDHASVQINVAIVSSASVLWRAVTWGWTGVAWHWVKWRVCVHNSTVTSVKSYCVAWSVVWRGVAWCGVTHIRGREE
jgi:hypothetical protein